MYINYLEFSLELSLLPIDLFNLFFFLISAWTHRYLFYNLGYNSTLLCFVVEIVLSLSTGSSFSWFLCPSDIVSSLYFFLFNNSSFSGPEDSPRNVDPPFLGNTISHNLHSKYVHCYLDIFTSRPFQLTRVATIWVYINTYICIQLYIYIYNFLCNVCIFIKHNLNSYWCFQL